MQWPCHFTTAIRTLKNPFDFQHLGTITQTQTIQTDLLKTPTLS